MSKGEAGSSLRGEVGAIVGASLTTEGEDDWDRDTRVTELMVRVGEVLRVGDVVGVWAEVALGKANVCKRESKGVRYYRACAS